jgi:DNA-binding transcriptional regulator YiaG
MNVTDVDEWGVTAEEYAEARHYSMAIDWSDEDQVFIASFPGIPFVRTHGATREEAAARGDEVIIKWLTSFHDDGLQAPSPLTARTAIVEEPPEYDAERIRRVRQRLNVSQQVFADLLNVSRATARSWEQGTRIPDGATRRLLAIAELYPGIIAGAAADPQRETKEENGRVLQVRSTQPRKAQAVASTQGG